MFWDSLWLHSRNFHFDRFLARGRSCGFAATAVVKPDSQCDRHHPDREYFHSDILHYKNPDNHPDCNVYPRIRSLAHPYTGFASGGHPWPETDLSDADACRG